jgi:hypothetical protein
MTFGYMLFQRECCGWRELIGHTEGNRWTQCSDFCIYEMCEISNTNAML